MLIITSSADELSGYTTPMTLNDLEMQKDSWFCVFFASSGCDAYFKSKLSRNYFKPMLSRVSWTVTQISCNTGSQHGFLCRRPVLLWPAAQSVRLSARHTAIRCWSSKQTLIVKLQKIGSVLYYRCWYTEVLQQIDFIGAPGSFCRYTMRIFAGVLHKGHLNDRGLQACACIRCRVLFADFAKRSVQLSPQKPNS